MENSPIKFLDYDASLMLADQVRISQEEEARRFHYNLYSYESIFKSTIPGHYYRDHNIICRVLTGVSEYWGDFWDEELSGQITKMSFVHTFHGVVGRRIILYEQELEHIMDGRKYLKSNF